MNSQDFRQKCKSMFYYFKWDTRWHAQYATPEALIWGAGGSPWLSNASAWEWEQ